MGQSSLAKIEQGATRARHRAVANRASLDEKIARRHEKLAGTHQLIADNRRLFSSTLELSYLGGIEAWSTESSGAGRHIESIYNKRGPAIVLGLVPDRYGYSQAIMLTTKVHSVAKDGYDNMPCGNNAQSILGIYHIPNSEVDFYQENPGFGLPPNCRVAQISNYLVYSGSSFFE